jgi:two-component system CheB/CheR fusion protein
LRRFFVEEQGGYRVGKSVRETVVFARHDLISDPPFSRMDLISCRNVLIYLEPSVQRRAIPTFHYSLKPDGLLVLGASESVGRYTDLFSGGARKYKIFTRKPGPTRALHLPIAGAGSRSRHVQNGDSNPDQQPTSRASRNGELDAQREADRVTITRYGPPGVVIDNALQILQFRGATKAFLEPPTGKATFDVLKMAKDGLMLPLRRTINQARQTNATAHRENVRVQSDDIARTVNLEVIPLGNREERCFLILFHESRATDQATETAAQPRTVASAPLATSRTRKDRSDRVANLEAELSDMREYFRSVQEQHATDNEELQTVNEEAQSANEELQSLNEELETSKEEIESINEELNTVNEEMNSRNLELNRLNNDLLNLQLSTKLALLVLKPDLTLRDFSPQASAQFDLFRGDVGRPINLARLGLTLTDGTPRLEDIAAQILTDLVEQEHEVCDRDGKWHLMRVRPYVTTDNQADGVVVVLIAIDALKRSEQAARYSVGELAATNQVINEFVASLAHELRGPLAPIVNALELMRESPTDGPAYPRTQEVLERQVGHMVHLVDDLLDASRVSRGTIEIRRKRIDLMSAVQIALDDARPACARKGVEIVVALPSEPIMCNADPTRVAQVVGNLLSNACKFTDSGGRVDLSVVREHERAVIKVRDTGIGISADQLPHIFELFMQVGPSLERGEGGLGIGLTIVKDMVERHGGTVEARSGGPGCGSEFEVHLPLGDEVARVMEDRREPGGGRARPGVKDRRILVVDDNRDMAESMAWLLELAGNEIRVAHEGVSALKAAAEFRPDIMLLDLGLPGLNGHEVARRIRTEPWGADITLVAVTGRGQEQDRRKSHEAGFDAHVVKPVGQAELMRVLAVHH